MDSSRLPQLHGFARLAAGSGQGSLRPESPQPAAPTARIDPLRLDHDPGFCLVLARRSRRDPGRGCFRHGRSRASVSRGRAPSPFAGRVLPGSVRRPGHGAGSDPLRTGLVWRGGAWTRRGPRGVSRAGGCERCAPRPVLCVFCCVWLRGLDLNQRPSGYEPDELPGCSTPRQSRVRRDGMWLRRRRFVRRECVSCAGQAWRRPTLPCLETQYHGRWCV